MTGLRDTATTIMPVGRALAARMFVCAMLSTLAACAGDSITSLALPTAAAPTNTAAPANAAAAAPAAQPVKPEPPKKLTATEINEECWMDPAINKIRDLDQRLKLVDKCVDQKTKAQGGL